MDRGIEERGRREVPSSIASFRASPRFATNLPGVNPEWLMARSAPRSRRVSLLPSKRLVGADRRAWMGIQVSSGDGVAEVVIDFPPVNALPVQGWFDLAQAVTAAGADADVRAVVLAANGRGFCAGVDIKEMQRTSGHEALVGANRGCFAAFAAVYECAVPVVAAVQGFCLGGGVGLAGSADLVVASEDATFGLPEVDRGALGAATHLARLVPQQLMRHMVYTCEPVAARELLKFGTVLDVVPKEQLRERARALAGKIAAKHPEILRLAK